MLRNKSGTTPDGGKVLPAKLVTQLIDSGIHFGHRVGKWNPKMKPYIFGKRNLIHVINVKETLRGILAARKFLERVVAEGKDVVFVGTKRQACKTIQESADKVGMHWVNDRWLGGTLTNFREIRRRVGRLDELEQMEADGLLDAYSKKQGATLRREMRKILRNLGGIRKMTALPGALVAVDQHREIIAIREARKLHIPVVCLLDTDSDPDLVDIPIPGNDDAMKAITLVIETLAEAIQAGLHSRLELADKDQPAPRRRSLRSTTARADETPSEVKTDNQPTTETPGEPVPADVVPATEAPATKVPADRREAPAGEAGEGDQTT
jgi:small subunit ribosomal protein S2